MAIPVTVVVIIALRASDTNIETPSLINLSDSNEIEYGRRNRERERERERERNERFQSQISTCSDVKAVDG